LLLKIQMIKSDLRIQKANTMIERILNLIYHNLRINTSSLDFVAVMEISCVT